MPRKIKVQKRPGTFDGLPGNHPAAYDAFVFVERRTGESTDDLLGGVLLAAAKVSGKKDGLGLHEAGAEIQLKDGAVLEAIGFGPMLEAMKAGALAFAKDTKRHVACWSPTGRLQLEDGRPIQPEDCTVAEW
jgi:hypothetical protein